MSATVLVAEDELLIAMDVMDELDAAGFATIGPFAKTSQAIDYCRGQHARLRGARRASGRRRELPAGRLAGRAQRADGVPLRPRLARNARASAIRRRAVCPKPARRRRIAAAVAELLPADGSGSGLRVAREHRRGRRQRDARRSRSARRIGPACRARRTSGGPAGTASRSSSFAIADGHDRLQQDGGDAQRLQRRHRARRASRAGSLLASRHGSALAK